MTNAFMQFKAIEYFLKIRKIRQGGYKKKNRNRSKPFFVNEILSLDGNGWSILFAQAHYET